MAAMEAERNVQCLAVSQDGRWIAAGTPRGDVLVWDAKTYERVVLHRVRSSIRSVDFSPDSARVVSASWVGTASIWDIATCQRVQTFEHKVELLAAKYSPQGGRIATASDRPVRVWDSNDGRLLVDIGVEVNPSLHAGLLWFNDDPFVISDNKIQQFETTTGSVVSEWPVPPNPWHSCIALPRHGKFIAYSAQRTVTFWDTAIHTQLGSIEHPQDINPIAVSSDDRFLAIGGEDGEITIHSLPRITVSTLPRWIVVHMNNFLTPIIFHRI